MTSIKLLLNPFSVQRGRIPGLGCCGSLANQLSCRSIQGFYPEGQITVQDASGTVAFIAGSRAARLGEGQEGTPFVSRACVHLWHPVCESAVTWPHLAVGSLENEYGCVSVTAGRGLCFVPLFLFPSHDKAVFTHASVVPSCPQAKQTPSFLTFCFYSLFFLSLDQFVTISHKLLSSGKSRCVHNGVDWNLFKHGFVFPVEGGFQAARCGRIPMFWERFCGVS